MIFLSYGASIGIVLGLIVINAFVNFFFMQNIKLALGHKSYYSNQSFIKKILLINNPNIPNKFFKILTYINYIIYVLVVIAFICHMIVYNQISSLVFQCISYVSLMIFFIFTFTGCLCK